MIDFLKKKEEGKKSRDFHTPLGYNYASAAPANRIRQPRDHRELAGFVRHACLLFFMPLENGTRACLMWVGDNHVASPSI